MTQLQIESQITTAQTLRCLFVGTGFISGHMHKFLAMKPWYAPAGAVDVRDDALRKAQDLMALPERALFKTLDDALANSGANVALINTPSELHFAQAKAALEAGLHVLIAKPITNNYEQAVELVHLAAQKQLTLCVGHQLRYNRHYQAVRRFIDSAALGRIGAVWFMNAKPRPNPANLAQFAQPALYEFACHHFDSLLAILGDPRPEWVVCDGFIPPWSKYTGPCMANALIRFGDNLHLSYHGGMSSQAPLYELRLEGTLGALRCRGLHMSNDAMSYEFAPALGQFAPLAIDEGIPAQDPFIKFFDMWHDYVSGGAEPPFSGRNNLRAFAMLSAAIDSTESGRPSHIASNPRYREAFR